MNHNLHLPEDDEPTAMSVDERSVWVTMLGSILGTVYYGAAVIPDALAGPIADVQWVWPMMWAVVVAIAFAIVGSIVAAIGGAVSLAARGRDPMVELESDVRDKEIGVRGSRAGAIVVAFGVAVTLVLAMVQAEYFWIGSALYAFGFVGAMVEAGTKIRLYRRGF
jgi:hypothetical protein